MFANPSEKVVDPVDGGGCDVNGILSRLRRKDAAAKQCVCGGLNLVVQIEEREASQQFQAQLGRLGISSTAFIDDRLRTHQVELLPMTVPPNSCQLLSRGLNQPRRRPGDVETGNRCLDVD